MNKFTIRQIKSGLKRPSGKVLFRTVLIACFLLVWAALQIFRVRAINSLDDAQAAKRFAPESPYAEVGVFFSASVTVPFERYREFHFRIEEALTNNSIQSESDNPSARLFIDACSAEGKAGLIRDKKNVEANVIGTGGDFFSIHPVELVSGMYYSPDDLMQDKILIDEQVAWQLFGSSDITGQTVKIGSNPYIIIGVVKTASGRMRKAAGINTNLVYMPLEALKKDGTLAGGEESGITCYEAVLPDPVKGFAKKIVADTLGFDEAEAEVIDVTRRFSVFELYKLVKKMGLRSMTGQAMRYPYWENMARGMEDILFVILLLQTICIAAPVIMAVYIIVQAYRHKKWTAAGVYDMLKDRYYEAQSGARTKRELQKQKRK